MSTHAATAWDSELLYLFKRARVLLGAVAGNTALGGAASWKLQRKAVSTLVTALHTLPLTLSSAEAQDPVRGKLKMLLPGLRQYGLYLSARLIFSSAHC